LLTYLLTYLNLTHSESFIIFSWRIKRRNETPSCLYFVSYVRAIRYIMFRRGRGILVLVLQIQLAPSTIVDDLFSVYHRDWRSGV